MAAVLTRGEPTKFRWEGVCRAVLRAHFILAETMTWDMADKRAARIIAFAFARIGVKRPTWEDGQPVVVVTGRLTFCASCGGLLGAGARKYCSNACRSRDAARRRAREQQADAEAMGLAFAAARANGTLWKQCECCGKTFEIARAAYMGARYCSRECVQAVQRKDKTRNCQHCGKLFEYGRPSQRYCSVECLNAEREPVEKVCDHCGGHFSARTRQAMAARFCSKRCGDLARYYALKVARRAA